MDLPGVAPIVRVTGLSIGTEVEVPYSAREVRYAVDADLFRWVAKLPQSSTTEFLAESVGYMMAKLVGVPTVDRVATYVDAADRAWWLSSYVPHVAHWEPSRSQALSNPEGLGAALALDAVLGVIDRHHRNLLVRHNPDGTNSLVLIDWGGAWVGSPVSLRDHGLAVPSTEYLAEGIPRDLVEGPALDCAERIKSLSSGLLWNVVSEGAVVSGIGEAKADELHEALEMRCSKALVIVSEYLEDFA